MHPHHFSAPLVLTEKHRGDLFPLVRTLPRLPSLPCGFLPDQAADDSEARMSMSATLTRSGGIPSALTPPSSALPSRDAALVRPASVARPSRRPSLRPQLRLKFSGCSQAAVCQSTSVRFFEPAFTTGGGPGLFGRASGTKPAPASGTAAAGGAASKPESPGTGRTTRDCRGLVAVSPAAPLAERHRAVRSGLSNHHPAF